MPQRGTWKNASHSSVVKTKLKKGSRALGQRLLFSVGLCDPQIAAGGRDVQFVFRIASVLTARLIPAFVEGEAVVKKSIAAAAGGVKIQIKGGRFRESQRYIAAGMKTLKL